MSRRAIFLVLFGLGVAPSANPALAQPSVTIGINLPPHPPW